MDQIEILNVEVNIAADSKFYGRWVAEIKDEDGFFSSATHFTPGFETKGEACAALARLLLLSKTRDQTIWIQ